MQPISRSTPVRASRSIERRLTMLWPQMRIAREMAPGLEPPSSRARHRPDLVYLDLQAPGLTGLQLAQAVADQFDVAFLTAFESHAVVAFGPDLIEPRPFGAAVREPKPAVAGPAAPPGGLAWIKALKGGEVNLIRAADVCYFRADAKYTSVVTADREFIIRRSIAALTETLDPALFCRIHRSTIVNLEAVAAVARDMSGETFVKLKRRPERLAVSETYRRLFRPM